MYDQSDANLINSIVIALFLVPILVLCIKRNLFKHFALSSLVRVLNWAFVIQLIECVLLLIVGRILDKNIDDEGISVERFTDVFIGTMYVFTVVGMMIYLPALVILNIANWIRIKIIKRGVKK